MERKLSIIHELEKKCILKKASLQDIIDAKNLLTDANKKKKS